jgi:hypothetical protein
LKRLRSLTRYVRWKSFLRITAPTFLVGGCVYVYLPRPAVMGLVADILNFVAAVWLAYDLLFKEHEVESIEGIDLVLKESGGRFPIQIDGETVADLPALERVFRHRTVRSAVTACLVLVLGLALLIGTRVLEFVEQGHVEGLWDQFVHLSSDTKP